MPSPSRPRLSRRDVASHLLVMASVAALMGVMVAGLAIPFAGALGIGARNVATTLNTLPAALATEQLPQRTRIVDSEGTVIATLYDENRVNVPLTQISPNMTRAIIAIEDDRYYQHGALDLRGTLRALVTNKAAGGVTQGGSSITQQMVKLTLLSQAKTPEERRAANEDTYARKVRELRYAIAFEKRYSKDWILERYLNLAYFGDGAFGVQAASRHYFDKDAANLNIREAATLAGLVKNPTGYDPTNAPDRALERRNTVIDRMAELNVITQDKAERLKQHKLGLRVVETRNGCVFSRAPFFCDYVINYLLGDRALGNTVEDRKKLLYSGGLTIHTTVNLADQEAADAAVRDHVYPTDQAIGALAIEEPGTGNVLAIAQSRPMGNDVAKGETYLNYVVPQEVGDSAGFQAGSTFKAFVLAAAINDKIPLNTTFNAQPSMTFPQSDYANCPGQPSFAGEWKVSNSTTSGIKNLYTGTRESVNTFYAQLEQKTGVCDPFNLARAMGVQLTNPRGDEQGNGAERVPTFTLGVANVSPLEMAEAYATFGARGLHCNSRPVTAIDDSGGTTVKSYPSVCTQVLPQSTADAVNDVLRGVQEPGGFGHDIGRTNLVVPSAGKTGTTQEGKSVWFIGYTPQIATAAMIAGADFEGKPKGLAGQVIGGSYVYTASGSGFAGPMWAQAMHVIQYQLDYEDFVPPSADEVLGLLVPVPRTAGMTPQKALELLASLGFTTADGGLKHSDQPPGTVAYTDPKGGTSISTGSVVTIYISSGPKKPPKDTGGGTGTGGGGTGGNGNGNGGPGNSPGTTTP